MQDLDLKTIAGAQILTVEQMAEGFAMIERHGMPDNMVLMISIDSLQAICPDLTDEVLLEEYGIQRGRDFAVLSKGEIRRGVFPQ